MVFKASKKINFLSVEKCSAFKSAMTAQIYNLRPFVYTARLREFEFQANFVEWQVEHGQSPIDRKVGRKREWRRFLLKIRFKHL